MNLYSKKKFKFFKFVIEMKLTNFSCNFLHLNQTDYNNSNIKCHLEPLIKQMLHLNGDDIFTFTHQNFPKGWETLRKLKAIRTTCCSYGLISTYLLI